MLEQVITEKNIMEADDPCKIIGSYNKVNAECQWPYDYYRELRKIGPLIEDYSGRRFWMATSYELVDEVLKSPLFIKNPPAHLVDRLPEGGIFGTGFEQKQRSLLNLDPPEHTRIRKLLTRAFTGVRVTEMEGAVQRVVDDLLDPIVPRGEMEFVKDYAYPIPSTAISSILGIPKKDETRLNHYSNGIISMVSGSLQTNNSKELEFRNAMKAAADFNAYLLDLFEERRRNPQDDLITKLIEAETEEGKLSDAELLVNIRVLYVAGHETTIKVLSNTMAALFRHRDQLEMIKADPSLVSSAIDEFNRYDSSVQQLRRVAKEDLVLAGKKIQAGELVICLIGSANHDEKQFTNPHILDITRKNVKPKSFGAGVHF